MANISNCPVSSLVWEVKGLGLSGKQKEVRLLNRYGCSSLSLTCDKCDAHFKTSIDRSDNDLCLTVTKVDGERFLSIHVPHSVYKGSHQLTIIEISGMPVMQRTYAPKTLCLLDRFPMEPYLGNSGVLIIKLCQIKPEHTDEIKSSAKPTTPKKKKRTGPVKYKTHENDDDEEGSMSPSKLANKVAEMPSLPEPAFPVTFVFENGEKLLACKAVLSIKSSVFAIMFGENQKDSLEGMTNEVKINDCDFITYKRFLQFLHFGKEVYLKSSGESLKECAERLLPLTNKYFIQELADHCAIVLVDNLTERTSCHILHLLQMYYNGAMKKQCLSKTLEFIKEHPSIMKNAERWNDLAKKYPELLREIITNCLTTSDGGK